MVLYKALEEKEQAIKYNDTVTNQDTGEIIDLESFLKRAEKNKKLRPNFLKKIHKEAQKEIKLRKVKVPAANASIVLPDGPLDQTTVAPTTGLHPAKTTQATGAGTATAAGLPKKRNQQVKQGVSNMTRAARDNRDDQLDRFKDIGHIVAHANNYYGRQD